MTQHRAARPWQRAAAGLLLLAGAVLVLPGGVEVSVTPVRGGTALWVALLTPGERFTLRYVHSVDRQPIWEEHSVDPWGALFVEEERFVMVGAGMGDLPGRGRWGGAEGLQSIRGMHYRLGEFVLRIGSPGVDHTLLWRDTATNLSAQAAGTAVQVSARPVSLAYRLWRLLSPHPATPAAGEGNG
ncbi:MAG: DUF1850 domain-containing protein [Deferrisomatales bacterium]|nr:DUF1850 domain-containing protein [Deferrisomatales bacterium]